MNLKEIWVYLAQDIVHWCCIMNTVSCNETSVWMKGKNILTSLVTISFSRSALLQGVY
jgi:hypothetical protein